MSLYPNIFDLTAYSKSIQLPPSQQQLHEHHHVSFHLPRRNSNSTSTTAKLQSGDDQPQKMKQRSQSTPSAQRPRIQHQHTFPLSFRRTSSSSTTSEASESGQPPKPSQHRRHSLHHTHTMPSLSLRRRYSNNSHNSQQSSSPTPPQPQPQRYRRHSFHLTHKPLSPSLHIPDLSNLITHIFAPNAFLYSSPTHEVFERDDAAHARGLVERSEGKGIARVDSGHVEEGKKKQGMGLVDGEEVDGEDGAPLCREAEIEKWKTSSSGSEKVKE